MVEKLDINIDEKFMKIAIDEAKKGVGKVNPNPLVGAVIVRDGEIVGKGHHKIYGGPHAEVEAVSDFFTRIKDGTLEGATMYVTLEPCSHYGKTPPCAQMLVSRKIKRCVIGKLDPNPLVAGNGVKILRDAGIEVVVGVQEEECLEINRVFFKYITSKVPYIFLKCAITLDGKIATKTGSSKWITNAKAREKVQVYRNSFMGIMVGKNTVINDNPELRTKLENGRDPYRIVIDSKLEIPENYKIVSENWDKKSVIITSSNNVGSEKFNRLEKEFGIKFITFPKKNFDLKEIFQEIGKLGIDSILVEGGGAVISQLFREKLIDAGEIFIAPKILGDNESVSFVSGFSVENISDGEILKNVKYNLYDDNIGIEFHF